MNSGVWKLLTFDKRSIYRTISDVKIFLQKCLMDSLQEWIYKFTSATNYTAVICMPAIVSRHWADTATRPNTKSLQSHFKKWPRSERFSNFSLRYQVYTAVGFFMNTGALFCFTHSLKCSNNVFSIYMFQNYFRWNKLQDGFMLLVCLSFFLRFFYWQRIFYILIGLQI